MIDMVMDEKDKQHFITDIDSNEKETVITYADGSTFTESFSLHNLGVWRTQMTDEASKYIGPYMDNVSKDSFFAFVKKYAAIILGVVGIFLLYNVDIHLVIKILLTILIVLVELMYQFYNFLYLTVLNSDVVELLATEYYLNNIEQFRYYDNENGTDGYIVPPEDIGKYGLSREMLEQIYASISKCKKDGFEPKGISLTYKRRKPENGKSMI